VRLYLCFNWAPLHEGVLGSGGTAPRILDLGTWWRWVFSFIAGRFTPTERAPGTYWTEGWVSPRAGLDTVVKRKIPRTCISLWNTGTRLKTKKSLSLLGAMFYSTVLQCVVSFRNRLWVSNEKWHSEPERKSNAKCIKWPESKGNRRMFMRISEHTSFVWPDMYGPCHIRGCIQKFPDWPPGARAANGTALCH
jgi:hypothetical protein